MSHVRWTANNGEAIATRDDQAIWSGTPDDGVVIAALDLPDSDDGIVLLDPDARPSGIERWHPFPNVLRISPSGRVRWRSELSEGQPTSGWKFYGAVIWRESDLVAIAPSWEVLLDPSTGEVRSSRFTK